MQPLQTGNYMGYMDLSKLTLDELVGVVNLYPWFGGARKELCVRMSRMGDGWSETQFADAALYVGARSKLLEVIRAGKAEDLSDAHVEELLKTVAPVEKKRVYAGVGDYFSQEEYDQVRKSDDNVFSKYAAKARQGRTEPSDAKVAEVEFYTETLAQIYAEQGYYEQAKLIYSKLILAYPEKSAYFATLIQKLEEIN